MKMGIAAQTIGDLGSKIRGGEISLLTRGHEQPKSTQLNYSDSIRFQQPARQAAHKLGELPPAPGKGLKIIPGCCELVYTCLQAVIGRSNKFWVLPTHRSLDWPTSKYVSPWEPDIQ